MKTESTGLRAVRRVGDGAGHLVGVDHDRRDEDGDDAVHAGVLAAPARARRGSRVGVGRGDHVHRIGRRRPPAAARARSARRVAGRNSASCEPAADAGVGAEDRRARRRWSRWRSGRPRGTGWLASAAAWTNISSSVETRSTPHCSSSESVAMSSPTIEPVCDDGGPRARPAVRPALTVMIGFLRVTRRASWREAARIAERLEVHQDRLDVVVVLPVLEQVVARDVGLVAHRDEHRDAEAALAPRRPGSPRPARRTAR